MSAVRADSWRSYYAVYNEMNMYELRLFRSRDDASLPLTQQQDRVAHMFGGVSGRLFERSWGRPGRFPGVLGPSQEGPEGS